MKTLTMLLAFCALVGCTAKAEESKDKEPLLFVVYANKGHYANGKLTLMNVSPTVSYFSDRPSRKAGTMDMPHFLDSWSTAHQGNFTQNPPDAGFVYFEHHEKKYSEIPVELLAPKYNEQQRTLTFEIKILENESLPNNKQFQEVSLFVDKL